MSAMDLVSEESESRGGTGVEIPRRPGREFHGSENDPEQLRNLGDKGMATDIAARLQKKSVDPDP